MDLVKLPDLFVCPPDRRKTGRLRRHHIHTNPEISTQAGNTGANKLHHFILHITILEYSADNGKRHILRPYAGNRCSGQINCHHAGASDIISLSQQLFHQLRASLSHRHSSKGTIAGMAVRSQNHLSAACEHLPGKLMDHSLVGRYIDAAVFFCTGKPKHMIIFIDRTAYRTQGVMTVRQHIGNRKTIHSGSPGCLDDSHKGNIMRSQFVKLDRQIFHSSRRIMIF